MSNTRFDVAGIGNAIVDVLAKTDDTFLATHALSKGAMTLIEGDVAERLYMEMTDPVEQSGGSAANTIAGLASLGASCAFIGKVHDDVLGDRFRDAIREAGVDVFHGGRL